MLKAKLFAGFAILVIIFGVLSALFAIRMIQTQVMEGAERRVESNINTALLVYQAKLKQIQTIVELASSKQAVIEAAESMKWDHQDLRDRLETIRLGSQLDFLCIVTPNRQVVLRTTKPYRTGDFRPVEDELIKNVFEKGKSIATTEIFTKEELINEISEDRHREIVEVPLKPSPDAYPTEKKLENRGLVMMAAAPIRRGNQIFGAVYGGMILNNNQHTIKQIKETVYGPDDNNRDLYQGMPVGTATIFLYDTRIATTITISGDSSIPAIGTRVNSEVKDHVLGVGNRWLRPTKIMNERYLAAYTPIRYQPFEENENSKQGKIIGMLYVGLLLRPFDDMGQTIWMQYLWMLVLGLILALVFSFWVAGRLARPIHRLENAANQMRQGLRPGIIPIDNTIQETQNLIIAFNEMTEALAEREGHLQEANDKLERANESLKATNRSYMETLGFVSHELKTPIATMMNYVFLLKEEKLGPLTEKQQKAIKNIDSNVKHVVEMIRHYLNLSRIENGVLQPVKTKVALRADLLDQMLENFDAEFVAKKIIIENQLPEEVYLHCDMNMAREVFENLISNAIKYGREQGKLRISSSTASPDLIEFVVANEGDGIPPEKIGTIFQKFSRLEDQQATRRQKGTGLGLFITKHIVEAHGGKIEVRSEVNQWTEFRFTLPAYPTTETTESIAKK